MMQLSNYALEITNMIYECEICFGVNFAARLHCQFCGTIPAKYSILQKPTRFVETAGFIDAGVSILLDGFIPVASARGCEHAEHCHTRKIYFRTVPIEYFE